MPIYCEKCGCALETTGCPSCRTKTIIVNGNCTYGEDTTFAHSKIYVMPATSELLPCPFCGGKLHWSEEFQNDIVGENVDCFCYQGFGFVGEQKTKKEMFAAANRRQPA